MDLLSFLQSQNIISPEVRQSVEGSLNSSDATVEQLLLDAGVAKDKLRTGIAEYYGIPEYTPDENREINQEVLEYVPVESARHYRIMPLEIQDDVLLVGVNDPEDLRIREVLGFVSSKYNMPYKFTFVLSDDLEQLLEAYENLTGEVDEALTSFESELESELAANQQESLSEQTEGLSREHLKEDAPVTKVVATILRYAIDGGASDIHVEPTGDKVAVRFRVDGVLQKSLELPKNVQAPVVARIKILSSLRLDEKRKPQDGRFSATFEGRKIDFRVSILPTNHGEKVVMRILDNERGISSLEETGISPHNLDALRRMMDEPYGIILISGPTGSGKSTTLYTMLNEMDRQTRNILSLEDPIEYNVDGVSQSQVRPEIGYTFANGLRSALRQDPDVILVGEIRDAETAELAIQAALTGHLVLSTIHTNNAIGVVARLVDMGIDPYLIAPTLKLAVAQRLSRRLCEGTGIEQEIDPSFERMMEEEFASLPEQYRSRIPETRTIMQPESTPGCTSGMRGRVAVMETLVITDEIQSLILDGAPESEIYKVARKNGFMSMKEDAIIKALDKVIPYQEVSMFGIEVGDESAISKDYLAADSPADESEVPQADLETGEQVESTGSDSPQPSEGTEQTTSDQPPVDNQNQDRNNSV